MEKFMESKFMQGFMIVAAKVGAQRHLVAIRDGFIVMMPIVLSGSLAVLINSFPINLKGDGLRTILDNNKITNEIININGNVYYAAVSCMSIFLAVGIGYGLSRGLEQDGIAGALVALAVVLACLPQTAHNIQSLDTTIAPALIEKHLAGEEIPGYTIEKEEESVETVDGTQERPTSYTFTKVDESGQPVLNDAGDIAHQETIEVVYTNNYRENEDGDRVLVNEKLVIESTDVSYQNEKMVSAYGLIPTSVINSTGLFATMILSLLAAELFCRLNMSGKITIKMPETVPPAISGTFASLLPGILAVYLLTTFIRIVVYLSPYEDVFSMVQTLVAKPLNNVSESYGAVVIVAIMTTFLWFFGLHGANIVGAVFEPISIPKLTENSDRVQNGLDAENIVTSGMFNVYVWLGGAGCTLALIIAIYMVSKSKAQRAVATLALVPGIFEVNEPIIFGLPIVLNASYFIPMLLVPFVLSTITYFATVAGICPVVNVVVPWILPPLISGFVGTGSFVSCIFQVINLVIATIIFLPFVKIADKVEERNAIA